MADAFRALLSDHLLVSLERQELARGVIGGGAYDVDLEGRTIRFSDGAELSAQILGSASSADGSWYWAWANPALGLPEGHLAAARQLQQAGRSLGVAELTEGRLELDGDLTVHSLGAVAGGLLGADAYFLAQNGPFIVLLCLSSDLLGLPALDGSALTRTIMDGVGLHDLPHRPMIESYLDRRGATATPAGNDLEVTVASGEQLTIRFDHLDRCSTIDRPAVRISTGTLVVTRRGGGWRDRLRSYPVLVDGEVQARLKPGATATLELPVGTHDVRITLDGFSSSTVPILIRAGATTLLAAAPGGSAGEALADVTGASNAYFSLRRA